MGVYMGRVLDGPDLLESLGVADEESSLECFACGQPLHPPMVFWSGFGPALLLHPDCSIGLSVALIGDARAIQIAERRSA